MLRALSLAILTIAAGPSVALKAAETAVVAQQQQQTPPQAAPRRDCEKRQEGIS
jgi:transcriptional regulator GlxA family with amidase domain